MIQMYQGRLSGSWSRRRRDQPQPGAPRKSRTRLEPGINSSRDLKQAYGMHRVAMYKQALEKFRHAVQMAPYDLNTKVRSIK